MARTMTAQTPQTRRAPRSPLADKWLLDPEISFLNHGSFGACPTAVLERQAELRLRMEREPVRFFVRELPALLDQARDELARFVGVEAQDLVFVPNVTTAVNAALQSLHLAPGDELLTTDHEYNACRNALEHVAARAGARVVVAPIPFPLRSPVQATEALLDRAGPRTRVALVDHVTSQTGLVLPVGEMVAALEARGVATLVDGAHAPGMLPLRVAELGATYYAANCHKWLCAPKGAGFLWARRDRQGALHPTTISHGYNAPPRGRSRYLEEFDWTGTDDPTAALCVPDALRHLASLVPGGWPEIMRRNRELCLAARRVLCATLEIEPPCPEEMLGSLAALPLPDGTGDAPTSPLYLDPVQDRLLFEHGIEVPVVPWPAPPKRLLRISAQLYNSLEEYERLGAALRALLGDQRTVHLARTHTGR
jgi:isopenicillin-N epimerase